MSTDPPIRFSVIIPTRDGEKYIGAAIDSVLAQTYSYFRVFVLESGSTDRTVEIVKRYADPRVVLLSTLEPLGMIDNWRRILDLELDPYMTILGHDDLLYPDFLSEIASLIEAEPEASLYHVQIAYLGGDSKPVDRAVTIPYTKPIAYCESANEFLRAVHNETEAVCATGYVMRSADYRRIGGMPDYPNYLYADVELWYRLTTPAYKVCSPRTLAAFRLHESNTHRLSDLVTYYRACARYLDFLTVTPYFKALGAEAACAYVGELFFRSHRNALLQLILTGDSALWRQYRDQWTRLKALAAGDNRLVLYDFSCRLHQALALVPVRRLRLALLTAFRRWKAIYNARKAR